MPNFFPSFLVILYSLLINPKYQNNNNKTINIYLPNL